MLKTNVTNTYHYSGGDLLPTAHITVGKKRIKQYNKNIVYLDNKQKFEIELFNPTTSKISAKIEINGEFISSSSIVLRPGERVFLERYLDKNNSFIFETYEVDMFDKNVLDAIRNNGKIRVEFYKKSQPQIYYGSIVYPDNLWWGNNVTIGPTVFRSSTANNSTVNFTANVSGSLETGVVGKGDSTNQHFKNDYDTYEFFSFHNVEWKILPKSMQPITSEDLNKKFCHECGTKIKKQTFKFCPHCGTKLEQ